VVVFPVLVRYDNSESAQRHNY